MIIAAEEPCGSVADLLHQLGDIPAYRVRMQPLPGLATEADVIKAMEGPRKRLCELMDGVLVEKAMGLRESVLAVYLGRILDAFVSGMNLGFVTAPDGTVRFWAGRVRIPDLAFFSWDRIPGRRLPAEPIPTLAPNLAVEILSASNTRREMELKRQDYFQVGVQLVWEIDPVARSVQVFTALDQSTTLAETDTLLGDPVLPGFQLPLRELFARLDIQG